MNRFRAILFFGGFSFCSLPQAATVNLNYNIGGQSTYVGGGAVFSGQFDLNASLDPLLFQSPFEISSARLLVNYKDDVSDGGYYLYEREEDRSGWSGWYKPPSFFSSTDWQRTYNNYSEEEYRNEEEFADITLSSGSAEYSRTRQDASTYTSNTEYIRPQSGPRLIRLGIRTITGTCGSLFGSGSTCTRTANARQYYYDYDYRRYRDYSQDRSASYWANSSVLEALSSEGILDFEIAANEGDFIVESLSLELNVTENVSAVPLPAAVWLFGSALVGLSGLRAKRR